MKIKVLFVCIYNSARSQMAEALLKKIGGNKFEVESAGLEPGTLYAPAVEVMKELGIDISNNKTKSVLDIYKQGKKYDCVITVCDESRAEQCPVFSGTKQQMHWNFADPSSFLGSHEDVLADTRIIRDDIQQRIEDWIKSIKE